MSRSFRGYTVIRPLGMGGMASIYLGLQENLKRQVAIKILDKRLALSDDFVRRFEREARAASELNHRNIITIHEFGNENDDFFIVMEYVDGPDLRGVLSTVGRIPAEVTLAMLEEVARGLAAAHERDIVHRDIKPANILFSKDGDIKITDFGLARDFGMDASGLLDSLTAAGTVLGTPLYMSPEQASSLPLDGRTDVFSLGVMAYEMLTGERPWAGNTWTEVRAAVLEAEPPPMQLDRPLETPMLENLVRRMIAKEPSQRPTAKDLVHQIDACMDALDPSGTLLRYRRRFLEKFAADPKGFSQRLESHEVKKNLDRGLYAKALGLERLDQALEHLEYVQRVDPDNSQARRAVEEIREFGSGGDRSPVSAGAGTGAKGAGAAGAGAKGAWAAGAGAQAAGAGARAALGETTANVGRSDAMESTLVDDPPAEATSASEGSAQRGRGRSSVGGWLLATGALVVAAIAFQILSPDTLSLERLWSRWLAPATTAEVAVVDEGDGIPRDVPSPGETTPVDTGGTAVPRDLADGTDRADAAEVDTPLAVAPDAAHVAQQAPRKPREVSDPPTLTRQTPSNSNASTHRERREPPAGTRQETVASSGPPAPVPQDAWVAVRATPPGNVFLNGALVKVQADELVVRVAPDQVASLEIRHPELYATRSWSPRVAAGDTLNLGSYEVTTGTMRVSTRPRAPIGVLIDGRATRKETPLALELGSSSRLVSMDSQEWLVQRVEITDRTAGGEARVVIPDDPRNFAGVRVDVPTGHDLKVVFHLDPAP